MSDDSYISESRYDEVSKKTGLNLKGIASALKAKGINVVFTQGISLSDPSLNYVYDKKSKTLVIETSYNDGFIEALVDSAILEDSELGQQLFELFKNDDIDSMYKLFMALSNEDTVKLVLLTDQQKSKEAMSIIQKYLTENNKKDNDDATARTVRRMGEYLKNFKTIIEKGQTHTPAQAATLLDGTGVETVNVKKGSPKEPLPKDMNNVEASIKIAEDTLTNEFGFDLSKGLLHKDNIEMAESRLAKADASLNVLEALNNMLIFRHGVKIGKSGSLEIATESDMTAFGKGSEAQKVAKETVVEPKQKAVTPKQEPKKQVVVEKKKHLKR